MVCVGLKRKRESFSWLHHSWCCLPAVGRLQAGPTVCMNHCIMLDSKQGVVTVVVSNLARFCAGAPLACVPNTALPRRMCGILSNHKQLQQVHGM